MCCIPNKVNMDQSHQVRKLHHMIRVDYQIHKQLFPRIRGNPKMTHATDNTKNKTNKIKYTGTSTFSRWENNQRAPKK